MAKDTTGIWERVPGSGKWYARWRHMGKLHREFAGSKTKARQLYHVRAAEIATGKLPAALRTNKKLKFGELLPDVLAYSLKHKRTVQDDVERVKVLNNLLGNLPAESLTPQVIEHKLGAVATSRTWSAATQNRYLSLVSLTYRLAIQNGRVTTNPARHVKRMKENSHLVRFLSADEEKALKAAVERKHPERWAIIVLALNTGCRAGELYGLHWTEVNLDSASPQIALLDTKNSDIRHVPLNADALAALEVLSKYKQSTDHVLPRQPHRMWFTLALRAAKIDNFRFHDLRHTFASRCTMSGVDVRTLAALMGHRTLQMTMRYSHLAPQHLQDAVSKLGAFSIHKVSTEAVQSS